MKTSETTKEIFGALAKAQRNINAAIKDSVNPHFKSKFADIGAIMDAIKEPLNNADIAILQPAYTENNEHFVETYFVHSSGEWISSGVVRLILSKNDMQGLGSAITYARRYQLQSFIALPAEDDDGHKSTWDPPTDNFQSPKRKEIPAPLKAAIQSVEKVLPKPKASDHNELALALKDMVTSHKDQLHSILNSYLAECNVDRMSKLSIVQLHDLKGVFDECLKIKPINNGKPYDPDFDKMSDPRIVK